jgi:O-antigen ligase
VRRSDRISLVFGSAALLVSVLAIGGALRWVQAIVAVLVALALTAQHMSRRALSRPSPLLVLIAIAVGLTAMQLIPLPGRILGMLDHQGAQLRSDGAALVGSHPWPSISLDPAGTLRALAFLLTLGGVAILTLRFATSERGRYRVLAVVALTCGLAAAVTGVHTLVNADSLYGLYEPAHAAPPILGPLLNANHLGSLMALGGVLAFGLAFYPRQSAQLRTLWIVISVGCALVATASLSRGAVIALLLGLLMAGGTMLATHLRRELRHRRKRGIGREVPIAITVVVGLALAVYANAGQVADQIGDTSLAEFDKPLSKYEAWRSSSHLIAESPWVGIGRGAFEPAFTRVHEPSAYFTFSHVENEYIQAVVDWGLPGALLLAIALGWCVLTATRCWRDGPLASAALGAVTAVLFQSTVDFGVELFGLAVPFVMVAATLLVVPFRETSRPSRLTTRAAIVAALVVAAAIFAHPFTSSVQEDHDDLVDKRTHSYEELRAELTRHPLDYFGYGQIAVEFGSTTDAKKIQLINHALRLHPTHPGLHKLAARMLLANRLTKQAAVEYSLAVHGAMKPGTLVAEIVTVMPTPADAAAALPTDYKNVDVLLKTLDDQKRNDVAEKWLARVVENPQHDATLIDKLYNLAMLHKDFDTAKHVALLRMDVSHTSTSRLMLAKVRFARKEYDEVLSGLADVATWQGRIDEQSEAWLVMCDAQREKKQYDDAIKCLHRLDGAGLLPGPKRVAITQRITGIEEDREHEVRAKVIEDIEQSIKSGSGASLPLPPPAGNQPGPSLDKSPIHNPLLKPKP